jgi:MATE family multidrug resistance protein
MSSDGHVAATLRLAAPLALAQLSQMAMDVTDAALLGGIGPQALAAGGLGSNIFFTVQIVLQGVLTSVSVTVANARGARAEARVPDIFRSGLLLATLLAAPAFLLMSVAAPLLRLIGESAALADDVGRYLGVLRWGVPAALLGMGLLRAFLPAIGEARLTLYVTLSAVGINFALNYGLIHGAWGLPRLGLLGSATATAITLWGTALALLATLGLRRSLRRWIAGGRARRQTVAELLRLGWPVAVTFAIETILFMTTGLLAGLFGAATLAAHQIALRVASTTFMVPLALAQAANVRVGFWIGAGRPLDARRAGLVAIALGGAFMLGAALMLILTPGSIVRLFLSPASPADAPATAIARTLLSIAAAFQVVDGLQCVASGALRGLRDTRGPMLLAAAGYWGVGLPVGCLLAFSAGLGAAGLWWGLAAGLAIVAAGLSARFEQRSRVGRHGMDTSVC